MQKNDPRYAHLVQILREELVPAMGCTEPISIAYGAAKARAVLGRLPERVEVMASGNIIKNVKSVVVTLRQKRFTTRRAVFPHATWLVQSADH